MKTFCLYSSSDVDRAYPVALLPGKTLRGAIQVLSFPIYGDFVAVYFDEKGEHEKKVTIEGKKVC